MSENEVVEDGVEAKPNHHQHKCWGCGTIWEHSNLCKHNIKAHECPKCKKLQGSRYIPGKDKIQARQHPGPDEFFG
ncbi:MAG: hypothetical protein KBD10_00565 [Candidatus Pacebacteria bacterium]|nr:hypothetical protein [Candidatus Paceibacterota bacterium]